jgi:hypothetical protein
MSNVISITGAPLAHDPALRGYHVAYRAHEVNRCPGCGRSHWLLGRALAECGFCATALPIAGSEGAPSWAVGLEVERG